MYSLNSTVTKEKWWNWAISLLFFRKTSDNRITNKSLSDSILDELPQLLVSIKDKEGKYAYVNRVFADMVCLPIDDVIGKTDFEIGFFLNPKLVRESDVSVFESGQKKHIPVEPMTDKFGNLYWFQTTKTPLLDQEKRIDKLLVISRDITVKLANQQRLSTSELRYRSIFENNYSGIIVIDRDLKITSKNRAFNKLVGVPALRDISDDLTIYISNEDKNDLKDLMLGMQARNYEYFDLNLDLNSNQGQILNTICFVRGLYDSHGDFTEAVVTFQDITAEVESRRELEVSENRFRSIFDNATEALLLLDYNEKKYIDANTNAVLLFGYTKNEILELKLGDLSPLNQGDGSDSTGLSGDYMTKAVQGENMVYEWIIRRKDGKLVPCEVRLAKLPHKDRTIVRTSVIDITDRKKAEHLLNLEKRKLQESNEELIALNHQLASQTNQMQEFAYISSHNLRSPAGNIRALLDFYQSDPNEDNLQHFINKLDIVSNDLMDTINELAEVVKIKNEIAQEVEVLYLEKLLDKTRDNLSQEINNKNARITADFARLTQIRASKTYMNSIFLNLVSNALKYSKDEVAPDIKVTSYIEDNKVVIEFEDNGLGIDLNKYGSKIFGLRKTFHRNKDSRGVGLFITKAQIEAMKGTITVQSTPKVGTKFTVYFPKEIAI